MKSGSSAVYLDHWKSLLFSWRISLHDFFSNEPTAPSLQGCIKCNHSLSSTPGFHHLSEPPGTHTFIFNDLPLSVPAFLIEPCLIQPTSCPFPTRRTNPLSFYLCVLAKGFCLVCVYLNFFTNVTEFHLASYLSYSLQFLKRFIPVTMATANLLFYTDTPYAAACTLIYLVAQKITPTWSPVS